MTGSAQRGASNGADPRPLAVVTGASSGIGYNLARLAALNGFDLVVAADEDRIRGAARDFSRLGANFRPSRLTSPLKRAWIRFTKP